MSLASSLLQLQRAKQMRLHPTEAEHRPWQHLRAHRSFNAKFKRQQPIGRFIVDFVRLEARLVVEADGGQHNEAAWDVARDAWLSSQGFTVLRFWNHEIFENLKGVLTRIGEHLASSASFHKGEGSDQSRRSKSGDIANHAAPSPSILAERASRCIGSPFPKRIACDAKPFGNPPPSGGREVAARLPRKAPLPSRERGGGEGDASQQRSPKSKT